MDNCLGRDSFVQFLIQKIMKFIPIFYLIIHLVGIAPSSSFHESNLDKEDIIYQKTEGDTNEVLEEPDDE